MMTIESAKKIVQVGLTRANRTSEQKEAFKKLISETEKVKQLEKENKALTDRIFDLEHSNQYVRVFYIAWSTADKTIVSTNVPRFELYKPGLFRTYEEAILHKILITQPLFFGVLGRGHAFNRQMLIDLNCTNLDFFETMKKLPYIKS